MLYNGTIIQDGISLAGCGPDTIAASYNPGFALEGLAVWSNVSGTTEWSNLYVSRTHPMSVTYAGFTLPRVSNLVSTSVPFSTWTGSNGVMSEGTLRIDNVRESYVPTPYLQPLGTTKVLSRTIFETASKDSSCAVFTKFGYEATNRQLWQIS